MAVTIKITGLDLLIKKFEKMPRIFITEMDKSIKRSAEFIGGEAKKVAPVDVGHLRRSIWATLGVLQAIIRPHVEYAIYVHEGHRQEVGRYVPAIGKRLVQSFVKGQPFMKQGLEKSISFIKRDFEKAVRILIRK